MNSKLYVHFGEFVRADQLVEWILSRQSGISGQTNLMERYQAAIQFLQIMTEVEQIDIKSDLIPVVTFEGVVGTEFTERLFIQELYIRRIAAEPFADQDPLDHAVLADHEVSKIRMIETLR